MDMHRCTVISYGEKEGETYRVSINPMNVSYVSANENMVQRQGVSLLKVFVKFCEEGSCELFISSSDLQIIEEAVATYMVEI